MGIQGLLPFLKKIHTPANIGQFHGSTVAVDAYCWLHKGAFSCAEKLALGEKTDQYVYYCMKYIDSMQRQNLKVIMVFDGCHLESKADVEKSRRERRDSNRKKAAQFLREGKRSEAKDCLQKCIDITPQMALELMKACRARGVDCIVAPYEADAQLAFLNKSGIAQIIVTEDSDLLLFGCEKIMFKMDFHGNGTLIENSRLNEVMGVQTDFYTFDKFRYMCILSGCDYLPSISGIGLAKANKVFKTARQGDVKQVLRKLPTYLKMNVVVSNDYVEGFIRANNTFLYQLVFDPLTRSLRPLHLHPPELKGVNLNYAGKILPQNLAYQIALGNIDIHNKETIFNFDPDKLNPSKGKVARSRYMLSIWDKLYRPKLPASPCKEIQTSEIANRSNNRNSSVVMSTAGLKKMLAKQTKDYQEPVITNQEMSSLYAGDDELLEVKRAKKNLMESADGFASFGDWDDEQKDPVANAPRNNDNDKSNCNDQPRIYQDTDNDSFEYTAANIGEETFKRDSKENKALPKPNKYRNIFAVSKTCDKKDASRSTNVEVKSWYFSSSKQSSAPVTMNSSQGSVSPQNSSVTTSSSKGHTANVHIIFEEGLKGDENSAKGAADGDSSTINCFKRQPSLESPPQQDLQLDENQNGHEERLFGSQKPEIIVKSDNRKSKESLNKNASSKKDKMSALSKLSAFSWSKAKIVDNVNHNDKNSVISKDSSECTNLHKSKNSSPVLCEKKRNFSFDLNSSSEPPGKLRKISPVTSNYFDPKASNGNSSLLSSQEKNSDSEEDIKEMQYQSYEGFLKSVSDDSYTRLLSEPKKTSDSTSCLHSKSESPMGTLHEDNESKRNCSRVESPDIIDLTKNTQINVKSTCRVPGLSKSKGKQKSLDSQQPRIQNFFSKYSFERKKTPQLRSTSREQDKSNYNDIEVDNSSISSTPILNDPVAEFAYVKRKLSL